MSEYDDGDLGLTEEESNLLGIMSDPDSVSKEKFVWELDAQREILSLLLQDKTFLIQSVDILKPGYFTDESHQLIARILFNYFKKYKGTPSKIQLIQEIASLCANKDSKIKVTHVGELSSIYEYYYPATDAREYYLDKITNFAKAMAMKTVFSKCMEEAEQAPEEEETWIKISGMLKSALDIDRNFDIGLDYFQSFKERFERNKLKLEKNDFFVTGFKEIDDAINGGLSRGEMGSIVGLSGTGKSLFLVKAALENLNRGHKVLYLSLEIDQDKVATRFDAQFANPSPFTDTVKTHNGITVKNLLDHEEEVFESLSSYVADKENKQLMIIKQFPAGDMDLPKMRAYYSQLVISGFQPDLIIVDYIGEMRDYPDMPTWESRQRMVRDMRGFGTEEQVCVLTAMQPNSKAKEVIRLGSVIDDDMLADSYGQIRPLDALWSLNQLPIEKECGLARIYVIKHRNGESKFTIYIQIDKDTLRMRQISEARYLSIKMSHENTRTVSAAEAVKLEQENNAKMANFAKAAAANKHKKMPETDAYNVLENAVPEPEIPTEEEKSKFQNDVGNASSEDSEYKPIENK